MRLGILEILPCVPCFFGLFLRSYASMDWAFNFLMRHGSLVLFLFVFTEQIGLPVSAIPILLAAGAIAASGRISFLHALLVSVLASLLADLIWYELGRRRGASILALLCRISLEPDSCVRRTEEFVAQNGALGLLYAKFVPGLSTAAPPLAGHSRMRLARFLALSTLGAIIYAGSISGLGFIFSEQLEKVAVPALRLGVWLVVLLVGGLAAYIAWKYIERQRFLRDLRIARITPEELQGKLAAGEDMLVVDLRHSLEFETHGTTVPGAVRIAPEEAEHRLRELPTDRQIVFYCT